MVSESGRDILRRDDVRTGIRVHVLTHIRARNYAHGTAVLTFEERLHAALGTKEKKPTVASVDIALRRVGPAQRVVGYRWPTLFAGQAPPIPARGTCYKTHQFLLHHTCVVRVCGRRCGS